MNNNKELRNVFLNAQNGNQKAIEKIISLFDPLVYKNSFMDGSFNDDLYQELRIKLLKCIKTFKFSPEDNLDQCLENVLKSINNESS